MKAGLDDTIFALATPPGRAALAVIRLSGRQALQVPELFGCTTPTARYAKKARLMAKDNTIIDEVLLLAFKGPNSATGEDCLEIHCHGSPAVIDDILSILSNSPMLRLAEAGEFSRRAFASGKMDMTAIEGLADLIEADTSLQRCQATAQMAGQLSGAVYKWRQQIIEILAQLEAVIDFADEDLPLDLIEDTYQKTTRLSDTLKCALDDHGRGEIIRNGLSVALIGPVNAGKSTALNCLARREAAIVSDQAGTTRDIIEVRLNCAGIPVNLTDSAGWRHTEDEIEATGIARARQHAAKADLVIIIIDGSQAGWSSTAQELASWSSKPAVIIANKADKGFYTETMSEVTSDQIIPISLLDPNASDQLEAILHRYLMPINQPDNTPIVTRARHREALTQTLHYLNQAIRKSLDKDIGLVAEDYRAAATALSKLTGHIDAEDLLEHIFSQFCIGK